MLDPSLSVGHRLLDEQHQRLFDLCAEAARLAAMNDSANKEKFHDVLNDVFVSATLHMRTEEELLREWRYPEVDAHAKEHKKFIERLTLLLCKAVDGILDAVELDDLLSNWWVDHVRHSDFKFKSFIRTK
jgi:hemerythrin-like metal-binding protein